MKNISASKYGKGKMSISEAKKTYNKKSSSFTILSKVVRNVFFLHTSPLDIYKKY